MKSLEILVSNDVAKGQKLRRLYLDLISVGHDQVADDR